MRKKCFCYLLSFFIIVVLMIIVFLFMVNIDQMNYKVSTVSRFSKTTQEIIDYYNLTPPFHVYTRKIKNSDKLETVIIGYFSEIKRYDFIDGENGMYVFPNQYLGSFWNIVKTHIYNTTSLSPEILNDSSSFVTFIKNKKGIIIFLSNNMFIIYNYKVYKYELLE